MSHRGQRVLLVDDDATLGRLGQRVLTRAGYEVVVTTRSHEALATFQAAPQSFAALITDYAMPGEDGCWLLRQVETGPHRVPVIVVTGFSDDPDVKSASFARVLRKPTDPWRLCADIREVLGQPHR